MVLLVVDAVVVVGPGHPAVPVQQLDAAAVAPARREIGVAQGPRPQQQAVRQQIDGTCGGRVRPPLVHELALEVHQVDRVRLNGGKEDVGLCRRWSGRVLRGAATRQHDERHEHESYTSPRDSAVRDPGPHLHQGSGWRIPPNGHRHEHCQLLEAWTGNPGRGLNPSVSTVAGRARHRKRCSRSSLKNPLSSAKGAEPSRPAKLPSSAISFAARMKPPHAPPPRDEPPLPRRTPSSARAESRSPVLALISTLTGFGATADTMASISLRACAPGAYSTSAPAFA